VVSGVDQLSAWYLRFFDIMLNAVLSFSLVDRFAHFNAQGIGAAIEVFLYNTPLC
jgi:hypothetical protein